jgi:hypothetical protein
MKDVSRIVKFQFHRFVRDGHVGDAILSRGQSNAIASHDKAFADIANDSWLSRASLSSGIMAIRLKSETENAQRETLNRLLADDGQNAEQKQDDRMDAMA